MTIDFLMTRWIVAIITLIGIAACSMTLPVRGVIDQTSQSFTGSATGYLDGGGKVTVILPNGATCNGNFVYKTERTGEGVFFCSDGRSGPFDFVSTGTRGTGKGRIGDTTFVFTFG